MDTQRRTALFFVTEGVGSCCHQRPTHETVGRALGYSVLSFLLAYPGQERVIFCSRLTSQSQYFNQKQDGAAL